MEDIPGYDLFQYFRPASQADDTTLLLQNPLPNLSLTGHLAQRRQRNLGTRMLKRCLLSPPQSLNFFTNLNANFPQDIPRATQTSPSASPTSSPTTTPPLNPRSPGQLAYRQSQVLYNQMQLRLNLLIIELEEETQRRGRCHTSPQPREPLVSLLEKQQEIAALQERIGSMVQAIQDLSEGEDGMWGGASLQWDGEEEAAAGSPELEEWIRDRLTNMEVNEAVAEAWREVYPEMELGWYL